MTTDFSYEIRVLMCKQCGGPLDADINGGAFECDYCGVTNHIVPRQAAAPPEPPAQAQVDDGVRLSRLRAQAGRPIPPPASVDKLLKKGMLKPKVIWWVTSGLIVGVFTAFKKARNSRPLDNF